MSSQPGSGFENFGRKIDETMNKAVPASKKELKKVITYLNDEVVPTVRQNSSKGLRIAAEQLIRLAEHIDRSTTDAPTRWPRRGQVIRQICRHLMESFSAPPLRLRLVHRNALHRRMQPPRPGRLHTSAPSGRFNAPAPRASCDRSAGRGNSAACYGTHTEL